MVLFVGKYNSDLQKWIDCRPRHVSWLSLDIQNELINTMAAKVLSHTGNSCRGREFIIMCDEISDRSNQELLRIVIRYVSPDGRVHEELIALISVPNTSAFCLYDATIAKLNDQSLSLNHLIGQYFDGASNKAEQYNGVQLIKFN